MSSTPPTSRSPLAVTDRGILEAFALLEAAGATSPARAGDVQVPAMVRAWRMVLEQVGGLTDADLLDGVKAWLRVLPPDRRWQRWPLPGDVLATLAEMREGERAVVATGPDHVPADYVVRHRPVRAPLARRGGRALVGRS